MMGYGPFSSPAHDTAGCIATQGLGGKAGRAWPGVRPSKGVRERSSTLRYGVATLRHAQQRARHDA